MVPVLGLVKHHILSLHLLSKLPLLAPKQCCICVVTGASCVILPDHVVKNPASLVQALATHRVTHMTAVPTLLHALLPYLTSSPHVLKGSNPINNLHSPDDLAFSTPAWPSCQAASPVMFSDRHIAVVNQPSAERQSAVGDDTRLSLKVVVSSGEPLTLTLAQALTPLLPHHCRLLNLYGCTEVAADCTCFDITTHSIGGNPVTSATDSSLRGRSQMLSVHADTDAKKAGPATSPAQHAPVAPQTGQHLSASALLPAGAQDAAHTSAPSSAAASKAASCQTVDAVMESGLPGGDEEAGMRRPPPPLQGPPSPLQDPLAHRTQVAVGWPLDGFAVFILPMSHALEQKLPEKQLEKLSHDKQLPHARLSEEAVQRSSTFDSFMKNSKQMPECVSPHGLLDKKRKRCLTDSLSEAAHSDPKTGLSHDTGDEVAVSCRIVEAGVVGEVAVAGAALALGYHRYGSSLGLQPSSTL